MGRITVPRYLFLIFGLVAGLWLVERSFQLVYRIADILLLFGLAWLLKLLVDPLIRRLQRWHFPRHLSIAIAYLLVIGGLIGGLIWLIPQLTVLAQRVPLLTREVAARTEDLAVWLQQRGVHIDPTALASQILSAGTNVASLLAQQAFVFAQSFLGVVGRIALVITISVYMSLTSGSVSNVIRPVVPPRWRDEFDTFLRDVDTTYSSYIRGYFYVVALGTLLSGAILFGFQIPSAVLWALFVFLLRLIPFIGGTLANTLLIAVLFFTLPLSQAVLATVFLLVGQMLLTNVFMPRIMSHTLGISPLLVLFAVLLGGRIYGLAGVLFAIPAAAIIATVVTKAVNRYLLPLYETRGWWTESVTVLEQHQEEHQPQEQTTIYVPAQADSQQAEEKHATHRSSIDVSTGKVS
jgi:predicted PurR-regulated permease PerM